MRKAVLLVLSCVACVSGCQWVGFKDECYYRWECGRLPIVKTTTPILVNPASGSHEAQALGAAAGPIQQGQFIQGTRGAQPMQFAPLHNGNRIAEEPCPPPRAGQWVNDPCQSYGPNTSRLLPAPSGR